MAFWRCTRKVSVFIPRPTRNAACGSHTAPSTPRRSRIIEMRPAGPHTTPASTSLCPARYFVALWTTRSIPKPAGRQFTGVANVASIIDFTVRRALQAAATRSRSTHDR